jgi:RimJ/RimL family protein N-acetyltransferase
MTSDAQVSLSRLDPSVDLESERVLLRRVERMDLEHFREIAFDEGIWRHFAGIISTEEELCRFIDAAVRDNQVGSRAVYAIVDKHDGGCAGSTAYGNISYADLRVEIGWTWLGSAYLGSGLNRHCKYLLMSSAFERIGFERIEFKTDVLNQRARRALEKLGAVPEGVLRSHTVMPDGRRRDTVYYSVLKAEWPALRERLFADIAAGD